MSAIHFTGDNQILDGDENRPWICGCRRQDRDVIGATRKWNDEELLSSIKSPKKELSFSDNILYYFDTGTRKIFQSQSARMFENFPKRF